jgi:hypothetical protein
MKGNGMASHALTPSQFEDGLRGEDLMLENGRRARHVVADGLKKRAIQLRAAGNSTAASRLDQLVPRVADGRRREITKKMLSDLRKEIDEVRLSLTGYRDGEYNDDFDPATDR